MKKIFLLFAVILLSFNSNAQERESNPYPNLTSKSKELTKAYFWNIYEGVWTSRRCNKLEYYGEGISCDNFITIFIGDYKSNKLLVIDKYEYEYKYPNLEIDWLVYRKMYGLIINNTDYENLKNLEPNKIFELIPIYTYSMRKNNFYTFRKFLYETDDNYFKDLTHKLIIQYEQGKDYAEEWWWNGRQDVEHLFITFMRFVDSKGKDVVRFQFNPYDPELFSTQYFETNYKEFLNLFTNDRSVYYDFNF